MKQRCLIFGPYKSSSMLRNWGKFSNRKGKLYKTPKGEIIYESQKFSNSLKATEILIYTRNSYPWQQKTEYPALHILELQVWNAKSKDKAALGKNNNCATDQQLQLVPWPQRGKACTLQSRKGPTEGRCDSQPATVTEAEAKATHWACATIRHRRRMEKVGAPPTSTAETPPHPLFSPVPSRSGVFQSKLSYCARPGLGAAHRGILAHRAPGYRFCPPHAGWNSWPSSLNDRSHWWT